MNRIALFLMLFLCSWLSLAAVKVDIVTDQLDYPWGMAQLPDGRFLVTEKRAASLRIVDHQGIVSPAVTGLPDIAVVGQGGLLDVALHPSFDANKTVYLSYSAGRKATGYSTEVIRGQLYESENGHLQLKNPEKIFVAAPKTQGGRHFGGRLLIDREGYLFISLGDRGQREFSQQLNNHNGSLIRVHDDGGVPADNPFVDQPNAKPEIYSYGHRNIQGMATHPDTGQLWIHEHGPQGGDEINVIAAGKNYGWPVITYGAEYGSGLKIGKGSHQSGMEQPVHFWDPSIAPSGMAFYRAKLWVGALKYQLLVQLQFKQYLLLKEQRFFKGKFGRIRDVRSFIGPDQQPSLYILTDSDRGQLIRIYYD